MRTRFQQGLDDLKGKLLAMGGMAEHAIDSAIRAYSAACLSYAKRSSQMKR